MSERSARASALSPSSVSMVRASSSWPASRIAVQVPLRAGRRLSSACWTAASAACTRPAGPRSSLAGAAPQLRLRLQLPAASKSSSTRIVSPPEAGSQGRTYFTACGRGRAVGRNRAWRSAWKKVDFPASLGPSTTVRPGAKESSLSAKQPKGRRRSRRMITGGPPRAGRGRPAAPRGRRPQGAAGAARGGRSPRRTRRRSPPW